MTLGILITQYKETDEVIKPLLDSIAIQQNVNWNKVKVYIGNDGSDIKISSNLLSTYSYNLTAIDFEHSCVAGTRQKLFEVDDSDYVMWCDGDDMFSTNIALYTIFTLLEQSPDLICSSFLEECHIPNQVIYHLHKQDITWVHGKVYSRKFITENELYWNTNLPHNEDNAFNTLAFTLSNNILYYHNPYYIWRWNDNSITRSTPNWSANQWRILGQGYNWIIDELLKRGRGHNAMFYAEYYLQLSYYTIFSSRWAKEYDGVTYEFIKKFYSKHRLLLKNLPPELKEKAQKGAEEKTKNYHNKIMPSYDEWLHSILTLY